MDPENVATIAASQEASIEAESASNEAEMAQASADVAIEVAATAAADVAELAADVADIQEDQSWRSTVEQRLTELSGTVGRIEGHLQAISIQQATEVIAPVEPEPEELEEPEQEIEVEETAVPVPPPAHVQKRLNRSRRIF